MRPLSSPAVILMLLFAAGCGPPGCSLLGEADPITASACEAGGGVWQQGSAGSAGTCRCYTPSCVCTIGEEEGVDSRDCTTPGGEPCQGRGCDQVAPPSSDATPLVSSDGDASP